MGIVNVVSGLGLFSGFLRMQPSCSVALQNLSDHRSSTGNLFSQQETSFGVRMSGRINQMQHQMSEDHGSNIEATNPNPAVRISDGGPEPHCAK